MMGGSITIALPLPLVGTFHNAYPSPSLRGGEADEAIRGPVRVAPGLLRCARNDGVWYSEKAPQAGEATRGLIEVGA